MSASETGIMYQAAVLQSLLFFYLSGRVHIRQIVSGHSQPNFAVSNPPYLHLTDAREGDGKKKTVIT
jgi:hypothetical protein